MEEHKIDVEMERILEGFALLQISPDKFPKYSDFDGFTRTFEICTAYEFVPVYTAQTTNVEGVLNAKLECGSK